MAFRSLVSIILKKHRMLECDSTRWTKLHCFINKQQCGGLKIIIASYSKSFTVELPKKNPTRIAMAFRSVVSIILKNIECWNAIAPDEIEILLSFYKEPLTWLQNNKRNWLLTNDLFKNRIYRSFNCTNFQHFVCYVVFRQLLKVENMFDCLIFFFYHYIFFVMILCWYYTIKFRKKNPGLIFFKGPFWEAYIRGGLYTEGNLCQ